MEKQKLIVVTNEDIIDDLRDRKDVIKLYPLKSFCVGYPLEFAIEKIDDYVLINRLLTNADLLKLSSILAKNTFKGIVFEDLGILELIKDLNVTKILMLSHIGNNVVSINYYLDYVDSVIVSTDITKNEIAYILKNSKKPLVLPTFGLIPLMYSRRKLLSNYELFHNQKCSNPLVASINDKEFKIWENEYGTVFYTKQYYFLDNYKEYDNVLGYFYNPIFLNPQEILKVLNNEIEEIPTFSFLLNQKTIYKLKEGERNG